MPPSPRSNSLRINDEQPTRVSSSRSFSFSTWNGLLIRCLLLAPVFIGVHCLAYWLRFEGNWDPSIRSTLLITLSWVVVIKLVVFAWFRIHRGWNRFVCFQDLLAICQAASISSIMLALGDYLLLPNASIPRSVFLMDWGITVVSIGGLRSMARVLAEHGQPSFLANPTRTSVFIVGANDSGEALLRTIRRNDHLKYRVVGFITDDQSTLGTRIAGVPVIGMLDQTCQLAKQRQVSEVLISAGELSGKQVRDLVDDGRQSNVTLKVLPSYEQLLRGNVDVKPRTVSIEDLLQRDPVQLNLRELHHWLDDQVLMVTGSAGSIGSEICRQLLQFSPKQVVLVDRSENGQFFLERELRSIAPDIDICVFIADINDVMRMDTIFQEVRPNIVFHAAAYKHVPLMEQNAGEAVKNIAMATRLLADLSHQYHVDSFVMISSDKAVNPTSVMGSCKRVAELYVQALAAHSNCRFITVRFGNVLDSAGSVVPIFRQQIAKGGPVTVTHPEMKRYFMTIPEASQLVIQAGAMGQGGQILVLDMGEPVRILELATDMIRLSGLSVGDDIEIEMAGIRPGEKLFEELHTDTEEHLPTSHPKILVANSQHQDLTHTLDAIDALASLANASNTAIISELQNIIPQYRHSTPAPSQVRRPLAA